MLDHSELRALRSRRYCSGDRCSVWFFFALISVGCVLKCGVSTYPVQLKDAYCRQLLSTYERQLRQGKLCNSIFNSSLAFGFATDALDVDTDELLDSVAHDARRHPIFLGGSQQDWWVWLNHARWLDRPGVFVDLATNHPIIRSNTYVLEKCLQWSGLCIEPIPHLHEAIRRERSCRLVPTCIDDRPGRRVPFTVTNSGTAGSSHLGMPTRNPRGGRHQQPPQALGSLVTVTCRTLAEVLSESRIDHIDVLSLDVEGHEFRALHTVNLSSVQIDIIIAESGDKLLHKWPALIDTYGYKATRIFNLGQDTVLLHPKLVLGIEKYGGKPLSNPMLPKNRPKPYHVECAPIDSGRWPKDGGLRFNAADAGFRNRLS